MNINLEILNDMLKLERVFTEKLKEQKSLDDAIRSYLAKNSNNIDNRIKKLESDINEEIRKEGSFSKLKQFLIEAKLLQQYKELLVKNKEIAADKIVDNIPYELKLAFLRTRINVYVIGRIASGTLEKRIKECKSLGGYLKEINLDFFSTAEDLKELEAIIAACIKDFQYWNPKNADSWSTMLGYGDGIMRYTPSGAISTLGSFVINNIALRQDITDKTLDSIIQIIFSTLNTAIKDYAKTNKGEYDTEYRKEAIKVVIVSLRKYCDNSCIIDHRTVPIKIMISMAEIFIKYENKLSEDDLREIRKLMRNQLKEKLKDYHNDDKREALIKEALDVEKLVGFIKQESNENSTINIDAASINTNIIEGDDQSEVDDEDFQEPDLDENDLNYGDSSQKDIYVSCTDLSWPDTMKSDSESVINQANASIGSYSQQSQNSLINHPVQTKKQSWPRLFHILDPRNIHPTAWLIKWRTSKDLKKHDNYKIVDQEKNTGNITQNAQTADPMQPNPKITVIEIRRFHRFCRSVSKRLHNIKIPKALNNGLRSMFHKGTSW